MARTHKEDVPAKVAANLTEKELQKVVSNVLAFGHHHHNYVSVNYFNKLLYGHVRSFISAVANNYEVGQTMLLEESFNDDTRITGRKLVCIVDNVGINITGLKEGYCVVTLRLK
jgi:hypothetical protein